jgi:hypothetical protein
MTRFMHSCANRLRRKLKGVYNISSPLPRACSRSCHLCQALFHYLDTNFVHLKSTSSARSCNATERAQTQRSPPSAVDTPCCSTLIPMFLVNCSNIALGCALRCEQETSSMVQVRQRRGGLATREHVSNSRNHAVSLQQQANLEYNPV